MIQLKPNYAEAYRERGMAYFSIDDYNRAIENFTRAIELDYDAYFLRAHTLNVIGDFVRAKADYALDEKIQKAR